MRGIVPDLPSGVPLAHRLPGVYQEEEFTQRFVSSFDDALAPVIATLDGLPGYVDPWLAPDDFVDWLAGWVGVEVDDTWSLPQRRAVVSGAALVHRRRGTREGIAEAVRLSVAGECEVVVEDSGATSWSEAPGADPPGTAPPHVTVRVLCPDPAAVDVRRVESLVRSVKPAHVAHSIEVVAREVATTQADPPPSVDLPEPEAEQEPVLIAPDEAAPSAPITDLAPSEATRAADTAQDEPAQQPEEPDGEGQE